MKNTRVKPAFRILGLMLGTILLLSLMAAGTVLAQDKPDMDGFSLTVEEAEEFKTKVNAAAQAVGSELGLSSEAVKTVMARMSQHMIRARDADQQAPGPGMRGALDMSPAEMRQFLVQLGAKVKEIGQEFGLEAGQTGMVMMHLMQAGAEGTMPHEGMSGPMAEGSGPRKAMPYRHSSMMCRGVAMGHHGKVFDMSESKQDAGHKGDDADHDSGMKPEKKGYGAHGKDMQDPDRWHKGDDADHDSGMKPEKKGYGAHGKTVWYGWSVWDKGDDADHDSGMKPEKKGYRAHGKTVWYGWSAWDKGDDADHDSGMKPEKKGYGAHGKDMQNAGWHGRNAGSDDDSAMWKKWKKSSYGKGAACGAAWHQDDSDDGRSDMHGPHMYPKQDDETSGMLPGGNAPWKAGISENIAVWDMDEAVAIGMSFMNTLAETLGISGEDMQAIILQAALAWADEAMAAGWVSEDMVADFLMMAMDSMEDQ